MRMQESHALTNTVNEIQFNNAESVVESDPQMCYL